MSDARIPYKKNTLGMTKITHFIFLKQKFPQISANRQIISHVAVGRGFEPQSDLELSFAKILIYHWNIFL
jgi:hypothetical protein